MFEALADLFNLATFWISGIHNLGKMDVQFFDHYEHHVSNTGYTFNMISAAKERIKSLPNSFKLRIMPQLLWAMGRENWTLLIMAKSAAESVCLIRCDPYTM